MRATLAGLLLAALASTLVAMPAAAQDPGGPYGSTSTTGGPGGQPDCQLLTRAAAPGESARVRLREIPRGTSVQIRLDGEVVAEATASQPGNAPRVTFEVSFVVPADTEPGFHAVTAVGAGFNVPCQRQNGQDLEVSEAQVKGNTVTRDGSRGGSLPRTGIYVALLVAVGLGLVALGRTLLGESHRRSRPSTIDLPSRSMRTPRR